MKTVTIRRGDTMFDIAKSKGVSLSKLKAANPKVDPKKLQVGQKLNVPTDSFTAAPATAAKKSAATTSSRAKNTTRTTPQTTSSKASEKVPYRNGHIPSSALTSVGGGHKMYGDAARKYVAMRDAAKRDGINLKLTDSYRSYAAQVDVAKRKGIYGVRQPNGKLGLAARPGTSNHGLGKAVDINVNDSKTSQWLQKNAGKFGFKTIPREPWHWEYKG